MTGQNGDKMVIKCDKMATKLATKWRQNGPNYDKMATKWGQNGDKMAMAKWRQNG